VDRIYHGDTIDYAGALRAIGQDVADLLPLSLEIEVTNGQFFVRGRGLREPYQATDKPIEIFLRKIWNLLIRHDPAADIVQWQLHSEPFTRIYTEEDIERWHEESSAKRKNGSGMPDIYSLGERLRIVGRMVDAKRSHLLTLCKSLHSVSFAYVDKHGQIHSETYGADDLYRMQQEYYANRKPVDTFDPVPARDPKHTVAA